MKNLKCEYYKIYAYERENIMKIEKIGKNIYKCTYSDALESSKRVEFLKRGQISEKIRKRVIEPMNSAEVALIMLSV